MLEKYKIASIVVTYNGEKWVNQCFGGLVNSSIKNHKIFAIDNGSSDKTISLIRLNFPTVEIFETGENLGFGKANNIGIKKAIEDNFDFVFLLNQDAWVTNSNVLDKLVNIMESNPKLGICSPMQYKSEKNLDLAFSMYIKRYAPVLFSQYTKNNIQSELCILKFVNAASWLISKKCFKECGGFAPIFNHYGEDSNYAERVSYHGFKIAWAIMSWSD